MIKAYLIETIKELETNLCEKQAWSTFELVEHVGLSLYRQLKKDISKQDKIILVCGFGNNGSDGLSLFEHLYLNGYDVHAYLLEHAWYSPENMRIQTKLKDQNINLKSIKRAEDIDWEGDIVVDALFGFGFHGEMREPLKTIMSQMNASQCRIISIDIVSGLHGDSGFITNACVIAHMTYVVGAYKIGQLIFDGCDVSGTLKLIEVGFDTDYPGIDIYGPHDLKFHLKERKHNVHKYDFKHVLVVGGSPSMMGAPILSSHAALVGGVGLVSLATYKPYDVLLRQLPLEIMTPFYENQVELERILKGKDVVVYGMGVSKDTPPFDHINELLKGDYSLIIDGDGLYWLKAHAQSSDHPNLILTPHLKELSDLLDLPLELVKQDVIRYLKQAQVIYQATIILKGPVTCVAYKDKMIAYQVGNHALATAGTGDVFAGLLASQVALNRNLRQAIENTLMIYHQSAQKAKAKFGAYGVIASDIITGIKESLVD